MHEKAHEKLFICTVCLKRFGYKCDLNRHMNKHNTAVDRRSSPELLQPQTAMDTSMATLPLAAMNSLPSMTPLQLPSIESLNVLPSMAAASTDPNKAMEIKKSSSLEAETTMDSIQLANASMPEAITAQF